MRINHKQVKKGMAKLHKHHKTPRSNGGSDLADNIVLLTPYDHALHHAQDFLEGGPDFDFRHEAWSLLPEDLKKKVRKEKGDRIKLNHPMDFPGAREKVSHKNSGAGNAMYGRTGEAHPAYGKPSAFRGRKHSAEVIEIIRKAQKGKKVSDATRQKLREASTGRKKSKIEIETRRQKLIGRKWWVNAFDETKFEHNCPGPEWQPGRKWRN
jgi:hypothetical protein